MQQKLSIGAVAILCLAVAGCTIKQTETPDLTGPSTYGTSVNITATPDVINLGQSTNSSGQSSVVLVEVRDANGSPLAGRQVRLDIFVDGIQEDCGKLSVRTITTDASGRASAVFTAPGVPVPLPDCSGFVPGSSVTVAATPIGSNFQTAVATTASIRLVTPTFIGPVGGLMVNFSISPNPGKVNVPVTFSDAGSVSPGHTIISYTWTFSDGVTKTGTSVTHDFAPAGQFNVTLTIADDIGQSSFKSATFSITN